ncbi:MAG: hypothetical protein QM756_31160 [Polyangiaceae bacterium]
MIAIRRLSLLPLSLALWLLPTPAHAEEWMLEGVAGLGSGVEGGVPGTPNLAWRRARTRVLAGFDMRSDEAEKDSFGLRAFAEIERRGGVGAELRYERWLGRGLGGYVFATGTIAPETLVGAGFGATFVIPFGKRAGVFIEPAFAALPLGTDVPDDSVILWATLSLGVRVGL